VILGDLLKIFEIPTQPVEHLQFEARRNTKAWHAWRGKEQDIGARNLRRRLKHLAHDCVSGKRIVPAIRPCRQLDEAKRIVAARTGKEVRSEEHTSELQSRENLV